MRLNRLSNPLRFLVYWLDSEHMGGPGGGGGARRGATFGSFGASSPNGASNGLRPKKGEEVSTAGGGPAGLPGMSAGLLLWRISCAPGVGQ